MKQSKEGAFVLRAQGKSYNQIAIETGVPKSTLFYWLKGGRSSFDPITPQQHTALLIKRAKAGAKGSLVHHERSDLKKRRNLEIARLQAIHYQDDPLWLAGVMLYWAEGTKQKPWLPTQGLTFVNTDARLHKIFRNFATKFFVLTSERLTYSLYIHRSGNMEAAVRHWSEELKISPAQIRVYFKKDNLNPKRKNIGSAYHGVFVIDITKSAHLNRRVELWYEAVVRLLPQSGVV